MFRMTIILMQSFFEAFLVGVNYDTPVLTHSVDLGN